MLTITRKDGNPQLGLQHEDLLADAGLGGIKAVRRSGHIEVVLGDFPNIAKLL